MNSNNSTYSIKIVNDINVTVPASFQLMTPYVLREQNDWFEDEIKFIRTFVKSGMKIIDIGANYGLYTLTIAKIIGDQGKIWAFEPTTTTAACLKQSISENKFNNIELIQAGLSDRIGKAKLFTTQNSELNSLSNEVSSGNSHETILLFTLDHCSNEYRWKDIDFIKLDAEGEEINILKKGKKFLSSASPLIMFELKHGKNINLPLIKTLSNLGYQSYRLIPGLNVLVPFNSEEPFDGFLLNLFCCKQDKSTLLESTGVIVKKWWKLDYLPNTKVTEDYLSQLPFAKHFKNKIVDNSEASKNYLEILEAYLLAHSASITITEKVGYLMTALSHLRISIKNGEKSTTRLATFARIAFDAGERVLGKNILSFLINRHNDNLNFEITEPFLPASSKYDSINPDNNIKEWLLSSIIEQYIIMHAFSTYFTLRKTLPLLEKLSDLGFFDENMKMRKELIESYC